MDISSATKTGLALVKRNSSTILTGIGVAGSVGSLILGIKATPAAIEKLANAWIEKNPDIDTPDLPLTPMEVVKTVWKDYIPAVGLQILTISAIVGSQSINMRRQATLISVATLGETAFREYQERVTAEAPKVDRKVRDDIAAKQIATNPVSGNEVVIVNNGDQLFFDAYTGRYFMSTMQKVDKAVNDIRETIYNQEYCDLNSWYGEIGIPGIPSGDNLGWSQDHPIEIDKSTHITDDDRAAVVITFVRQPISNFYKGFR